MSRRLSEEEYQQTRSYRFREWLKREQGSLSGRSGGTAAERAPGSGGTKKSAEGCKEASS